MVIQVCYHQYHGMTIAVLSLAIYVDATTKTRRWKKAQIVEESASGKLKLNFENMTEYYDIWVARDSPDIAPPNTKSKEEMVCLMHMCV